MIQYSIIYADPPWSYRDKSLARGGAEKHYRTLTLEEICKLNIGKIAATNAALFIWGCWPLLFECRQVIEAWGFKYKTCAFVWVKANRNAATAQTSLFAEESLNTFWGMGHWTRSNTEFCLLGVRGIPPKRISGGVHQVIYEPISLHSAKPDEARKRIINLLGDLPRVELFARNQTVGWDVWGNEVESTITNL